MEYNKRISAIAPGDEVEGYYILKSANPKVAANGKPFLTGALSDKTGTIELKVWDYPGTDFLSMFSRFATTTLLLYIALMTVHMIFRDNGLVPLDRVVFTLGIIVGTNLSVRFVTARERRETPHSIRARNYPGLGGMGFFLFALHDPMLTLLKRIAMKLSGTPSDFSLTVIYILIPLLVIAIAGGLSRLLNCHTPSRLKTLTGR